VNVDGAFVEVWGWGCWLQSDNQKWEGGMCCRRLGVSSAMLRAPSAEEVELMVCREGVRLALERSPKPTILESDCST
jgi:hypothetical protein